MVLQALLSQGGVLPGGRVLPWYYMQAMLSQGSVLA